jgi:hypothetical protein
VFFCASAAVRMLYDFLVRQLVPVNPTAATGATCCSGTQPFTYIHGLNDSLFAERARQNGMDLIDNEHADFELSRRDPGALP